MSFIDELRNAGKVALDVRFQQGTPRDFSGNSNALVINGSPVFSTSRRGLGLRTRTGSNVEFVDAPSLRFASSIFTVCAFFSEPLLNLATEQRILSKRTGGLYDYEFMVGSGNVYVTSPSGSPNVPLRAEPTHFLALTCADYRTTRYFQNGTYLNQSVGWDHTFGNTAAPVTVCTMGGGGQPVLGVTNRVLLLNQAMTDADMVRLYNEITRAGYALDMPHRKFSFPHRTLTPAQAVAQGLVLDTDFVRRSDGKVRNLAPTAYAGTLASGTIVPGLEGVGQAIVETTQINWGIISQLNGATRASLSWNVQTVSPVGASRYIFLTYPDATHYFYLYVQGGATIRVGCANGLDAYGVTASNVVVENVQQRFSVVYDGTGATNADRLKLYVDGSPVAMTFTGTIPATLPDSTPFGGYSTGLNTISLAHTCRQLRIRAGVAMTAAQVRAEYLEGAKRLLLDGRLRSDGSCPVSLTPFVAANSRIPTTDWETGIVAGTVSVKESANGSERFIEIDNNAKIGIKDPDTFGTWYWETESTGDNPVIICASDILYNVAPQNGYLYYCGVNLQSGKVVNGTFTGLAPLVGMNVVGHRIKCLVSRTPAGLFTFWISDQGAPWVQSATFTDTTFTTGKYTVLCSNSRQRIYNFLHFQGAMTPAEATSLGLIDP